jgi:hypothetical protein
MNYMKNTRTYDVKMFEYHEELAITPDIECEKLAVVVTYNRKEFINKWLRAWCNAEHYGVEIAVIHTFDGEKPEKDETENILGFNPRFYIPIYNTILRDYGPLVMVLRNMVKLPKWKQLFWFTDDMLPMRRNFLKPFVEKISKKDVGLVAQCYEPKNSAGGGGHIRTIAYATKREVTDRIKLPDPSIHKSECGYELEYRKNHMLNQVINLGYKFELCHSEPESPNYQHWTSYLDWMWDCHLLGHWSEYWDVYEEQFNPIQKIEGSSGSLSTIIDQGEGEKRSVKANKTTIIVTTSFASFKKFSLCLISLVANTRNNHDIENIVVNITGPDRKSPESALQDKKQELADVLSCVNLGESRKNIIVMRSWSPLTHGRMIEQALGHVNTENYMILQDHVFMASDKINDEIINFDADRSQTIRLWDHECDVSFKVGDGWITTPNACASLALCKTSDMKMIGASWSDYSISMEFHVGNFVSQKQFLKEHQVLPDELQKQNSEPFLGIDMPPGTFVQDKLVKNKCGISWFEKDMAESMNGWADERFKSEINKLCKIDKLSDIIARIYIDMFDGSDRIISTRLS